MVHCSFHYIVHAYICIHGEVLALLNFILDPLPQGIPVDDIQTDTEEADQPVRINHGDIW